MLFLICLEVLRTILTMEGMFIQTQSPAKNENARKAVPSHTHTHTHRRAHTRSRESASIYLSIKQPTQQANKSSSAHLSGFLDEGGAGGSSFSVSLTQRFTTSRRCAFSNAAATRSLSASCLFTAVRKGHGRPNMSREREPDAATQRIPPNTNCPIQHKSWLTGSFAGVRSWCDFHLHLTIASHHITSHHITSHQCGMERRKLRSASTGLWQFILHTFKRRGSDRRSFTRMHKPIKVAMLQWGMVGVNITVTKFCSLSTITFSSCRYGGT